MSRSPAEYMREFRRNNPESVELNRRGTRARTRALERLANLYPIPFTQLVNEERATEGLPPLGVLKPGQRKRTRQPDEKVTAAMRTTYALDETRKLELTENNALVVAATIVVSFDGRVTDDREGA